VLRPCRDRPRSRHASEKRDELTPPHCLPRRFASMVSAEISLLKGACPLWVISGLMQCKTACPLYPRKRTCAVQLGMSAKCQ